MNPKQCMSADLAAQLLQHQNKILEEFKKSNINVDVIYLDLANAFDCVDQGKLLNNEK